LIDDLINSRSICGSPVHSALALAPVSQQGPLCGATHCPRQAYLAGSLKPRFTLIAQDTLWLRLLVRFIAIVRLFQLCGGV